MKGSFFHLSQSIYRKVQNLGLQTRYRDDGEFAVSVQMLPADNVFGPIITYFEDNYIGRMRGSRRVPCNFPPRVWNMFDRAKDELPRTNNNVEGYHRRLQSSVSAHHPSLWKFLDILKREQALNRAVVIQANAGQSSEPINKK